ncbi:MAG: hypothetical protein U0520_02660 [Candidatus Saccharimonadales bacterium]
MDDIQRPQPTESPLLVTPAPAPTAYPTTNVTPGGVSEPRNFLATFLLASYGGILGLRNFYLGQKALGFVRLGLFLGYFLLIILGIFTKSAVVGLLGSVLLLIAYIWSLVDFFVVYLSVKTDAEGQPLTRTARDSKWAKTIFIVTVVMSTIVIIGGIVLALTGESLFKKAVRDSGSSSNSLQSDTKFDYDYNSDYEYNF